MSGLIEAYRYERRQWRYKRRYALKNVLRKRYVEPVLMAIAGRLDRDPAYCWPALVNWAVGYSRLRSIITENDDYKNRECKPGINPGTPYYYCGKCDPELKEAPNANKS